jgi:PTS system nitrogen regulatory IIA component
VHVEAFEDDDPEDRPPSLATALRVGNVHHDVGGGDREATLRAVVACLPLPETFDRELLVEVLVAREAGSATSVGSGIAIPNVRDPIVAPGAKPLVAVCYLATPVPFDAPDGQPIRTMIVAVMPTVRAHLRMVARLARALVDASFKGLLEKRAELDELIGEAERIEATPPPEHVE